MDSKSRSKKGSFLNSMQENRFVEAQGTLLYKAVLTFESVDQILK